MRRRYLLILAACTAYGQTLPTPEIGSLCPSATTVALTTIQETSVLPVIINGNNLTRTVRQTEFPATVRWDSEVTLRVLSATPNLLVVAVPMFLLTDPGDHIISASFAPVVDVTFVPAQTATSSAVFSVLLPPQLRSATVAPFTAGSSANVEVLGGAFIPTSGQCPAGTEFYWDGQRLDSADVQSTGRIRARIPAALATAGQHTVSVLNHGGGRSNVLTVNLTPSDPIQISPVFLPGGVVGRTYSGATVTGTGGTGSIRFTLRQNNSGLTIDPVTGAIGGVPTVTGPVPLTVVATDATGFSTEQRYEVLILPRAGLRLTGLPAILTPQQQTTVSLTLDRPFPTDLTGTVSLDFAPDAAVATVGTARDPRLAFGSTALFANPVFTIPAGTTSIDLPLQSGTVAGTVRTAVQTITANGFDVSPDVTPSATAQLPATAPTISACVVDRSPGNLTVRVTGISNTREMRSATFTFAAVSGRDLGTNEISRSDIGPLFADFYGGNSGPFVYDQSFAVQGSIDDIGLPTVTLTNAVGASAATPAVGCQ